MLAPHRLNEQLTSRVSSATSKRGQRRRRSWYTDERWRRGQGTSKLQGAQCVHARWRVQEHQASPLAVGSDGALGRAGHSRRGIDQCE
jgi:hypothetical protein